MQWDDLRYVLAVHRSASLVGAARKLDVSSVTVSRRIGVLEKALGVRLFDRTRTGHVATAAARDVIRQAEAIEAEIASLERSVLNQDQTLEGTVRLTTFDAFGTLVLLEFLAGLRTRHPGIDLTLSITNELLNLTKRDADIATRPTTQPPENLVGHRLVTLPAAVYASPKLVSRRRARQVALREQPWVTLSAPLEAARYRRYREFLASQGVDRNAALRVDSTLTMITAVQAGVGIGVVSCIHGRRLGLVRLTPPIESLETEVWILTHPELRSVARVAAVYGYLREAISARRAEFEPD